jgi:Family of unknown function (DUF6264)
MEGVSEQQAKPVRPPQVTVACAIVMVGSVFVVLLVWDRIAGLHTLETQQALRTFLNRSDLRRTGIDLASLVTIVKVVSMVSAACAVAMVVLGWQVAQRSHSARLALTILAGPLFLTGLVGDGFVSSAAATFWCSGVGAAVLTLWLGPTRVWFGEAAPATADRTGPGGRPPSPRPDPSPFRTPPPPPTRMTQLPPAPDRPPAWAAPPTSAYDVRPSTDARPRAVLWACLITWLCTGLAALGLVLSMAMMAADPDSVVDEMYRQNPALADQGISQHTLLTLLFVISAVVLAASVAAAVFALLLFLGRRWAWYAVVVAACGAAILFLIAALGSPVSLVMLAASVATIAFLVRPEVRAWLVRR